MGAKDEHGALVEPGPNANYVPFVVRANVPQSSLNKKLAIPCAALGLGERRGRNLGEFDLIVQYARLVLTNEFARFLERLVRRRGDRCGNGHKNSYERAHELEHSVYEID